MKTKNDFAKCGNVNEFTFLRHSTFGWIGGGMKSRALRQ